MLTFTAIISRSILAVATVGSLAVLADGAVRSQLEQTVRSNLSSVARTLAPVQFARADERYIANGRDRSRLGATVRMVGADNEQ